MTEAAPGTDRRRRRIRRTVIALIVIACLAGLGIAGNATRRVDVNGDVITEESDGPVVESGDPGIIADQPAPPLPGEGDDEQVFEQLFPGRDAAALQQQQVGVDLAPGFTGVLVVNDVEIPEDELIRVPGLNQVFFTPAEGASIEELDPGRNCATAVAWPAEEPRGEHDRTTSWCFEVT